jgi:hypothetical protein
MVPRFSTRHFFFVEPPDTLLQFNLMIIHRRFFQFPSALSILRILLIAIACSISLSEVAAQSRDINFPSPITSNSISGTIPARALGDGRLTTYYYVLAGGQGDVFINVTAMNFSGDIDIFVAGTLRPLSKMVFYADPNLTETGRVVYLRKPERMILRVEGRTPNDDEAKFTIKFAGSFLALNEVEPDDPLKKLEEAKTAEAEARAEKIAKDIAAKEEADRAAKEKAEARAKAREVLDSKPAPVAVTKPEAATKPAKPVKEAPPTASDRQKTDTAAARAKRPPTAKPEPPADPLANIRLVVYFKDGTVIDRPLPEVLRFNVEKGVLTIVAKDGSIGRYSMLVVDRVSVQ